MVIQHNLQAFNANRMNNLVTSERAKSAEKLASGYKVNRAADNAASLSISEKMRKQIRGLTRASTNGKDGISLAQTADGALHEVHEMLQRCNVLSIQAANGTLSPTDRQAIDNEIKQLKREINTINTRTKFNETQIFCSNGHIPTYTQTEPPVSIKNAMDSMAMKITDEYFPNAVNQILNTFSPLGETVRSLAENGKTPYDTKLSIDVIDGPGNAAASMGARFTNPNQNFRSGSLIMNVDRDDFPSLSVSSNMLGLLETTIAHEVMHGVMDVVMPTRMCTSSSDEDFPLWFIEGTAQLAGGGYAGGWNYGLTEATNSLANGNDSRADAEISSYLSSNGMTVDNTVYGHGYLAVAYAGYLASNSSNFSKGSIISGINKIFQNFIDNPTKSFSDVIKDSTGITESELKDAINNGSLTSPVSGKASPVEFVRRLTVASRGGSGSLIAESLSSGGQNIIGYGAKKYKQPMRILDVETKYVNMKTETGKPGHNASLALHLGNEADMNNKIEVYLFDISTDALNLTDINLLTAENATNAIEAFGNAILMVSGVRSYFGAVQNRVEHTVYNLNNIVENTTAAESRIRDTDMAEEMVKLSAYNILQQAEQSILAQANQTPQGVMSLLQQ